MFKNYYYIFNQLLVFLGSSLKNHETGSGLRLALLYLWHSLQQDNPLSLLNDISLICLLIRPDLIKVFVQSHVSMPPQAHVVCVSVQKFVQDCFCSTQPLSSPNRISQKKKKGQRIGKTLPVMLTSNRISAVMFSHGVMHCLIGQIQHF